MLDLLLIVEEEMETKIGDSMLYFLLVNVKWTYLCNGNVYSTTPPYWPSSPRGRPTGSSGMRG